MEGEETQGGREGSVGGTVEEATNQMWAWLATYMSSGCAWTDLICFPDTVAPVPVRVACSLSVLVADSYVAVEE